MGNMLTQGQQQITAGRQMLNNNPAAQEALIAAGLGMLKNANATRDIGGGYYMRDRAAPLAGGMEGAMGVMAKEKDRQRRMEEEAVKRVMENYQRQEDLARDDRRYADLQAGRVEDRMMSRLDRAGDEAWRERTFEAGQADRARQDALKRAEIEADRAVREMGVRTDMSALESAQSGARKAMENYASTTARNELKSAQGIADLGAPSMVRPSQKAPSWTEIIDMDRAGAAQLRQEFPDASSAELAMKWYERKSGIAPQARQPLSRTTDNYFGGSAKSAIMGGN